MDRFDDLIKSKIVADLDEENLLNLEQIGGTFGQLVKRRIREIEESDDFPNIWICFKNNLFISLKHHTVHNWNWALHDACAMGNLNFCNLMIAKGANDWNSGLFVACRGGNLEVVNLMINKGADDWNYGLHGACKGDHSNICKLMIAKGATRCFCGKALSEH